MTVEVEYNPRKTDPEGLACAMDRLLETALSIPEVMDEYGNPTISEFFVAKETVATPAPKVVLNMGGGLVQEVFASDPAITVALVDWDTEGCDPSDNGIVEIPDGRGGTQLAHVAECPVEPLEQLAGTETEAALKAAGLDVDATSRFRPNRWPQDQTPVLRDHLDISGGVLQDVFGSDPAITLRVVDWDTEGCNLSDNGIVEIPDGCGGTQLAHVAEYSVCSLEELRARKPKRC